MKSLSLSDRKEALSMVIGRLYQAGWAPATSSNYSFIEPTTKEIWISASGLDKGKFEPSDLMPVDLQGNSLHEDLRKSSAETLLHTLLYDLFPDSQCILHTHSVYNTVLSQAHVGAGSLALQGYEVQKAFPGIVSHTASLLIPIFENSQDMQLLSHQIRKTLETQTAPPVFLLAGHGMYTWATDIATAFRQTEAIEFLLECEYKLRLYQSLT